MKTVVFDPAGNHGREGNGITGVAHFKDGDVDAIDEVGAVNYKDELEYWEAVSQHIKVIQPDHVVIEGFKLYNHKKSEQVGSELQTSQLIGFLKMVCYSLQIPVTIQFASDVKTRWSDDVLVSTGVLDRKGNKLYWKGQPTNSHKRDSIRHGLHFTRYGKVIS